MLTSIRKISTQYNVHTAPSSFLRLLMVSLIIMYHNVGSENRKGSNPMFLALKLNYLINIHNVNDHSKNCETHTTTIT